MKIGILGGAFDPIHLDHVKLAEGVLDSGLVDTVFIMPCYKHRGKNPIGPQHRFQMARLACKDSRVAVSNLEYHIKHNGSTFELFDKYLVGKDDADEFYLIVGLDNARVIHGWHRYEELLKLVPIIVVRRAGEAEPQSDEWFMSKPHNYLDLGDKIGKMSSTLVKHTIETQGFNAARKMLHPSVLRYIRQFNLYNE